MDTYDYMMNNINGYKDNVLIAEIKTDDTVRYAVDIDLLNLEMKILIIKREIEEEYGQSEFKVKIEGENQW